jgi:hypothetical protein
MAMRVLRAKKIKADKITASVVFANKLQAKSGTVGRLADPLPDLDLAEQIGDEDLKTDEITVDVLYADHIQAGSIAIVEAHVSDFKIKTDGGDED